MRRTTCGHRSIGGAAMSVGARLTTCRSSLRNGTSPQCIARQATRIPGRHSRHPQVRPMYRPSGLARKMSAPLFRVCACPFKARPALANRSSSQSEATLTKTSASLGVTFGVASEPMSETRLTPRSLGAASVNRSTPMRRNVRRGTGSSGFELTGLSRRVVIAAA